MKQPQPARYLDPSDFFRYRFQFKSPLGEFFASKIGKNKGQLEVLYHLQGVPNHWDLKSMCILKIMSKSCRFLYIHIIYNIYIYIDMCVYIYYQKKTQNITKQLGVPSSDPSACNVLFQPTLTGEKHETQRKHSNYC